MAYTQGGILFNYKKNGLLPFVTTWLELEIIILKITQVQKDKYHMISFVRGIFQKLMW
jgi:hypothetical protein